MINMKDVHTISTEKDGAGNIMVTMELYPTLWEMILKRDGKVKQYYKFKGYWVKAPNLKNCTQDEVITLERLVL